MATRNATEASLQTSLPGNRHVRFQFVGGLRIKPSLRTKEEGETGGASSKRGNDRRLSRVDFRRWVLESSPVAPIDLRRQATCYWHGSTIVFSHEMGQSRSQRPPYSDFSERGAGASYHLCYNSSFHTSANKRSIDVAPGQIVVESRSGGHVMLVAQSPLARVLGLGTYNELILAPSRPASKWDDGPYDNETNAGRGDRFNWILIRTSRDDGRFVGWLPGPSRSTPRPS
jgi:hypothetical protein